MYRIKSGSNGAHIPPEAAFPTILWVVGNAFDEQGVADKGDPYDCVLTSGIEGKHGWSSEHFKGDAADFRIRHLPDRETAVDITQRISEALGDDFDVVLEDSHIHVEYDPKKQQ